MVNDTCAKCNKRQTEDLKLLRCGRCKSVTYCSKQCQKADWKAGHKLVCSPVNATPTTPQSHPHSCTCVDCGNSISGRKMLWRMKDGVEVFMGIVMPNADCNELLKLDDPNDVQGPGHLMNDAEFFSECFHYDDPSSNALRLGIKDISRCLVDFPDKLSDYKDSEDDRFDIKFPSAEARRASKPQIRSGDEVKIVAYQPVMPLPAGEVGGPLDLGRNGYYNIVERFWVQVVSVTATGMVTGISCFALHNPGFGIHDDDWVAFPAEKVLGMTKGEHWES